MYSLTKTSYSIHYPLINLVAIETLWAFGTTPQGCGCGAILFRKDCMFGRGDVALCRIYPPSNGGYTQTEARCSAENASRIPSIFDAAAAVCG